MIILLALLLLFYRLLSGEDFFESRQGSSISLMAEISQGDISLPRDGAVRAGTLDLQLISSVSDPASYQQIAGKITNWGKERINTKNKPG